MEFPKPAKPGDVVSVVAPSGPFDVEAFEQGAARLTDFDLRIADGLQLRRKGFFAGSDEARLLELQESLDDPDVRAIFVARGGYGLGRILPHLDWSGFVRSPKWVVGFSDTTCLHAALNQTGFGSIHGPHLTGLGRAEPALLERLRALLMGHTSSTYTELLTLAEGQAEGPLCGGNLTVLFCEAVAGRLKLPEGGILLLEDVTETSYRVDRMLTALHQGGHFATLSGLVFGDFTDCSPGRFEVPVETVLRERALGLGVPVVSGLPVGHGERNEPLALGAWARLDANAGTFSTL